MTTTKSFTPIQLNESLVKQLQDEKQMKADHKMLVIQKHKRFWNAVYAAHPELDDSQNHQVDADYIDKDIVMITCKGNKDFTPIVLKEEGVSQLRIIIKEIEEMSKLAVKISNDFWDEVHDTYPTVSRDKVYSCDLRYLSIGLSILTEKSDSLPKGSDKLLKILIDLKHTNR